MYTVIIVWEYLLYIFCVIHNLLIFSFIIIFIMFYFLEERNKCKQEEYEEEN